MTIYSPIPTSYYQHEDVLFLGKDLLGKWIFTCINEELVGGFITEVESYQAPEDKASHAYQNRRTKRNEVMFHSGGKAYIYLCYGMHHMANVVTNKENIPHAILIRSFYPIYGIETILKRRRQALFHPNLTVGPGNVCQALGLNLTHNGISLESPQFWIEDRHIKIVPQEFDCLPRVGIDYAQEWSQKLFRFKLNPLACQKIAQLA